MIGVRKKVWPFPLKQKNCGREIEHSKQAIQAAENHFEQVADLTLIDCYIYE